uniref:NBS-LRR disease resistance protein family-2 n=1 Tax=Oryza brachyantha TaxID=4533 RepID=B9V0H4_ORYBR|nr:NBS-LRR disease resistance protein family-2 [Oryza brachyantha]
MKKLRGELEKITKQHKDFSFSSDSSSNIQQETYSDRRTSPKVEEAAIVGRTQEKQKLLDCLSDKVLMKDFIILAIYGMGGIGKTTLAQLVFNDKQFKEYAPAWVHVSQVFDLDKIENSIISQLSKRDPSVTHLEMVPPNMNIIIVLDDLWENDGFKLDNLKLRLKVGKGTKVIVIVTTRHKSIANRFSTVQPYLLEPLTDDMCWKIIKQKSAFEDRHDKELLEQTGMEIATKCGGVALAALSVGYMLHSKKVDEWESVRDSDIWNESASEDTSSPHHVLSSLKLSYVRMNPCLKMCFGYCAIFQKGQKIVKDDLIHQWICLDFIEPSKVYSSRQLGEIYVTELLGMSFLQHSKSSSATGVHQENVTLLTMHDLVHDLASSVMVDEILVSSKQDNNDESSYRYALLNDSSKPLDSFIKFANMVKALRFVDCTKTRLHDGAFSGAKYLRVLDLSECFVQKLPDYIGQLRQLRYLSAPEIQDETIPDCITKLSKLMYLNLRGSSKLRSLPKSIGEMDSLMHLDLSGCSGIQRVPRSFRELNLTYLDLSNCFSLKGVSEILGNLTKLQHLCLSFRHDIEKLGNLTSLMEQQYYHISTSFPRGQWQTHVFPARTRLERLNISTELTFSEIKWLPEATSSFTKLKYLNLSGWIWLEELPRSWGNLQNLIHLDVSYCVRIKGVPEALSSLTKLQYLNLSRCCRQNKEALRGLEDVVGKLTELRYFYLSKCLDTLFCEIEVEGACLNFLASLSSLSNLEELDLSNNDSIESLPESIGDLRNLQTLNLSCCWNLSHLPTIISKMDSLKHLNLSGCDRLDKSTVPKFDSSSILLPQFEIQPCDGESSSNLVLLQDVDSTTELEISKLENVATVEEAARVRLKEKEMIEELALEWTRDLRRFVEDRDLLGELEPPSKLKWFKLQGYSSVAFPDWLMNASHLHHFACLKRIDLVDLPRCTRLPLLGQLPGLKTLSLDRMNGITKIDGEFYGGAGAFRQLRNLSMSNMENLETWQTTYSTCGNGEGAAVLKRLRLYELEIHHCPKLSITPCPPEAVRWEVEGSDGVLSSWPNTCASSSSAVVRADELTVKLCKLPLRQWRLLHQLTPLKCLTIDSCTDLSSSPEITRALSTLRTLSLKGNDGDPELPSWIGELTRLPELRVTTRWPELTVNRGMMRQLSSLRCLILSECARMTSLPDWLEDLPSLRDLRIESCAGLSSLEGGSMERLTSLKWLALSCCPSIAALPESLGELTSLTYLGIFECPNIKFLPESIQRLTNLNTLTVSACPELKKWCQSKNRTVLSRVPYKTYE